jgi:hypothetical protein
VTPEERKLRLLALKRYGHEDSILKGRRLDSGEPDLRSLVVTQYQGAYGEAGYVVAVEGSPPRGTFITVAYGGAVYITSDGRAKRLPEDSVKTVLAFVKQYRAALWENDGVEA